ncbi:hypothetical protein DFQ09_11072 [Winogradskyella pacifica]|uniref:Bacteriorhodopsin n=1 Tax=Winogradskyella pacifica TaxID=664642 RepID=A0A3D9LKI6_9FLAO|nr:hypothetical protein [Winogradskyella pacifica]REE07878.1 hypothetical protein DFQ09_11072 [Winogradskyella pacifica]
MDNYDVLFHYFELAAALAGSYYWLKTKEDAVRPFVWYLWMTVFIETVSMYTYLYSYFDTPLINWIESSIISSNTWLYNIYDFISLILIGMFMIRNTNKDFSHRIIKIIVLIGSVLKVIYFSISGDFFIMSLPYNLAVQTFALFIMFLLYLRELIQSEQILNFYKSHVFYISLGITLWYICLTPLFIFDSYYNAVNENFIVFRGLFLDTFNILLYSCYTFAFLYSLRHKKQLAMS